MLEREIRNFVTTALAYQRAEGLTIDQAKTMASSLLGCEIPIEEEFNDCLSLPSARRRRGRPRQGFSKGNSVAAVAVYFELLGAGKEQAITEAMKWLRISVSRRVAKEAVAKLKVNLDPTDVRNRAVWEYTKVRSDTTQPLPDSMPKTRKKRQSKSQLG